MRHSAVFHGTPANDEDWRRTMENTVRDLTQQVSRLGGSSSVPAMYDLPLSDIERRVTGIIRLRKKRAEIFGDANSFGEPVWDMLLQLFASKLGRRKETISSLCTSSGVPCTTVLRHVSRLESRGLVFREEDQRDRRKVFVQLTEQGCDAMTRFFAQGEIANGL